MLFWFSEMKALRGSTMEKQDENNKERWTQVVMKYPGYLLLKCNFI